MIDDSPEVFKLMHLLLKDESSNGLPLTGEDGLRILHERGPDLVLSDVMTPGMDGHELSLSDQVR